MKRLLAYIRAHERTISSAVFLGGFALDSATLTLSRIDFVLVHALFTVYLVLTAVALILTHYFAGPRPDSAATKRLPILTILPIAIQFFLGALFSGCLVFYTKSANLYASWPFLLLLLVVFVGNEVLKRYRERIVFQASLFFFALYSYALFAFPIAVGRIGTLVFLGSGIMSVAVCGAFLLLLRYVRKEGFAEFARSLGTAVAGILAVVHLFYFTGILPPLPLALKDAGVYHRVARSGEGYAVAAEKGSLWPFMSETLRLTRGESAYAYSAVFAPVALTAPIVHRWQRYDDVEGIWKTESVIPFFIRGGRDAGYRGYSEISQWRDGKWRVSIETEAGAVIGYIRFTIETVTIAPELHTEIK